MRWQIHFLIVMGFFIFGPAPSHAETGSQDGLAPVVASKPRAPESNGRKSVEDLTSLVRKSVVVVSFSGRDGRRQGLGSGFVVSDDGLIATNRHVIGEARPISVQTADGTSYPVTEIHATDRTLDLAVIRIDANGLAPLPLGDSSALQQGQDVVAVGNPRGLKHSVVTGVVSGKRSIDDKPMIQLAMPIEQGNSGGPVLDRFGRVHGILTLKSLVTRNLGFAVEINALKSLLKRPNPVAMERWLTIGRLDPREWTELFGANWRQRAGRILVEGRGKGFGGRSLCLSAEEPPGLPFEVAVRVKLEQDDGAAGLVIHSDGDNRHYGFYPSSGRLRFSRFDGPDVYSWSVLDEVHSPHYRPGEWNALKVRVEEDKIQCFVNDKLVIESADSRFSSGHVGLAKFRHTEAQFKGFELGKTIAPSRPSAKVVARITKMVGDLSEADGPDAELIDRLTPEAPAATVVLRERAKQLEQQAEQLRRLARSVYQSQVRLELAEMLQQPDDKVDLLRAALLVARLDNEDVDVDAYVSEVERMAADILETLPEDAGERQRLDALNDYLFDKRGFHGSRTDYYNRSNSYLNEVIDDREGLPILLSVLYMEIARRLDLSVSGVGLPGHFVVRFEPAEGDSQLLDPFNRAQPMTRDQAVAKVKSFTGREFDDEYLRSQTKQEILIRMLFNLRGVAEDADDQEAELRYVETMVAIDPESPEFRAYRTQLRIRTERIPEAIQDIDWFLKHRPPGADLQRLRQLRATLERSNQ